MARPEEIVRYWFGGPEEAEYGRMRKAWFGVDEEFDEEARRRFTTDYELAASGNLPEWEKTPEGSLALVLLLDQLPSMMFRGDARAFATDEEALRIAREAIEKGHDRHFPPLLRWFYYLPFEHSENLEDQRRAVELFRALPPGEETDLGVGYAERHLRVIERFGRFPNRNAALDRQSTPEEEEFLAGPDAPF